MNELDHARDVSIVSKRSYAIIAMANSSFCAVVPVVPVEMDVPIVESNVAFSTDTSRGLAEYGPSNSITRACHPPEVFVPVVAAEVSDASEIL